MLFRFIRTDGFVVTAASTPSRSPSFHCRNRGRIARLKGDLVALRHGIVREEAGA